MATTELFTVTFWEVTASQVVHAAAGSAVTALVAESTGTSVPWYGLLMAAVIGGLTALLLALAGKLNPNTGPGTALIPTPKAVKRIAVKRATPATPKRAAGGPHASA